VGLGDDSLWEVQWHSGSGRSFHRFVLTRRGLRRFGWALGFAALLVLAILALMPFGLQGVFAGFTLDEARRENRALKREGELLRERAQGAALLVQGRVQRARRLAWTLGAPSGAWQRPLSGLPDPAAGDEVLLAWLLQSSERLLALVETLEQESAHPRFPLRTIPLVPPVTAERAVPVSLFGWHSSPFTGKTVANHGIMLAARLGESVTAPGDGVVTFAGTVRERRANEWTKLGTVVVLDHGNGVYTVFGHLQDVLVRRGQALKRGQGFASVGQSGWTRVPAVYYEIRWPLAVGDSKPIDPALVGLGFPLPELDARLADPTGGLPDDFSQLGHLVGGGQMTPTRTPKAPRRH
jgi:murein DD-endopeptidase MepM/ murein hydrolase activator NlpD